MLKKNIRRTQTHPWSLLKHAETMVQLYLDNTLKNKQRVMTKKKCENQHWTWKYTLEKAGNIYQPPIVGFQPFVFRGVDHHGKLCKIFQIFDRCKCQDTHLRADVRLETFHARSEPGTMACHVERGFNTVAVAKGSNDSDPNMVSWVKNGHHQFSEEPPNFLRKHIWVLAGIPIP